MMDCCPEHDFSPWSYRLQQHLGPKSKMLPLRQMLYYLRNCIIRPSQLQIATFFSMYDVYSTITELPHVNIVPEVFNMPAANLKILHKQGLSLPIIIFEYRLEYQISPEDRDYLILQVSGIVPVKVQNELIRTNSSYRQENKELYSCVTPYPSLFDCEKVTIEDLTQDFTSQFISATKLILAGFDDRSLP